MATVATQEAGIHSRPAETGLSQLLPKGLSPQQICEQYFEACRTNSAERWLATLHLEARLTRLGPFYVCDWELGRVRVEKYKAAYVYQSESKPVIEGSEPTVTLSYQPLYGAVPGFTAGEKLGPEVKVFLKKEGGERGEWRVLKGTF